MGNIRVSSSQHGSLEDPRFEYEPTYILRALKITEVNSGGGAIPATGLATVRTLYGRLISASAQFFF